MARIAFDNDKYLQMQSAHIRDRIAKFGGKLYLEFGGKLYDDNHASRVLPGFQPDSKLRMLLQLKDQVEMVITRIILTNCWALRLSIFPRVRPMALTALEAAMAS